MQEVPLITSIREVDRDRFSPSIYHVRVNTESGPMTLELTERAVRGLRAQLEEALRRPTAPSQAREDFEVHRASWE